MAEKTTTDRVNVGDSFTFLSPEQFPTVSYYVLEGFAGSGYAFGTFHNRDKVEKIRHLFHVNKSVECWIINRRRDNPDTFPKNFTLQDVIKARADGFEEGYAKAREHYRKW